MGFVTKRLGNHGWEVKFEIEKFCPRPGIEPGPLALRASALSLRHPGQLPIQGRINLFLPILYDLRTTTNSSFYVIQRHAFIYLNDQ